MSGAAASRCRISTCGAVDFPLWTSEPGVGRDKTTEITFKADVSGKSGGDYWNTNYPQPTYLSSRRYALHVETTAYSAFDFRRDGLPRDRGLGRTGADRAHGAPDLHLTRRSHVRALRPPAAAAGVGLWWRDHRPEGWCELVRAAGEPSSRPARRCPACGARIGWACATPPSARACSGTGRRTTIAIRACASASPNWRTAASASSATSIPILPSTAPYSRRRRPPATSQRTRAERRLSWISASSIAASSISPIRRRPPGSPSV